MKIYLMMTMISLEVVTDSKDSEEHHLTILFHEEDLENDRSWIRLHVVVQVDFLDYCCCYLVHIQELIKEE